MILNQSAVPLPKLSEFIEARIIKKIKARTSLNMKMYCSIFLQIKTKKMNIAIKNLCWHNL
ncbi:hypothetical protein GCM10011514_11020 [Emticicia aquatilis]|uniref:Uncharacterized protein n=1 Tax=Emticicia aquatilis TaxID=1537369 RepID=A0A917DLU0_9BACT|nr:hypothetical protein GCM10011514_11020 [Emticicia aquatilis]